MARIDEAARDGRSTVSSAARPCPSLPEGFSAPRWRDAIIGGFKDCWASLAQQTETPNPFFEPWYLLPSLEQFDPSGRVRLARLVHKRRLVALMPLARSADYYGRPLPHFAAWSHANIFCGEPLIAPGHADAFWTTLLDWCDSHARLDLFAHFPAIPADGASFAALRRLCDITRRPLRIVQTEERAALRAGPTPEEHLDACLVKKRRKELARKRRRLEEMGEFVFARHRDDTELDRWIGEFLALERAGWKGENGSALACDPRTERLFRDSLHGAATSGRLERLAFHLDSKPIAMLCSFDCPPHSFSYKTAYDESLHKLSPGVLLQVEHLDLLTRPEIALTDSCAAPGHPMIDHFWRDRREMAKLSVAIGGPLRRKAGAMLAAVEANRGGKRR